VNHGPVPGGRRVKALADLFAGEDSQHRVQVPTDGDLVHLERAGAELVPRGQPLGGGHLERVLRGANIRALAELVEDLGVA
jgi:hypothetical protein